jgi:hypothetical protein
VHKARNDGESHDDDSGRFIHLRSNIKILIVNNSTTTTSVFVHDVLTMIGGNSTEAEGTSEKGMIARDRREVGQPAFTGKFPLRSRYSNETLPDPHTGTYCIYVFFYDDDRNICVLLVTTPPATNSLYNLHKC